MSVGGDLFGVPGAGGEVSCPIRGDQGAHVQAAVPRAVCGRRGRERGVDLHGGEAEAGDDESEPPRGKDAAARADPHAGGEDAGERRCVAPEGLHDEGGLVVQSPSEAAEEEGGGGAGGRRKDRGDAGGHREGEGGCKEGGIACLLVIRNRPDLRLYCFPAELPRRDDKAAIFLLFCNILLFHSI